MLGAQLSDGGRPMRKTLLLAVVLVSSCGIYVHAQNERTIRTKFFQAIVQERPVSVTLEADSVQRLIDVRDIGVIKQGSSAVPLTLSGNVVIVLNGIRITAHSAVYHSARSSLPAIHPRNDRNNKSDTHVVRTSPVLCGHRYRSGANRTNYSWGPKV